MLGSQRFVIRQKQCLFLLISFRFTLETLSNYNKLLLFTNIPLEETIDNIINDLYLSTEKVHNFEKHELKQLLMFAAFESFFVFDGEYYIQVDGVAMGSPFGPTLAMLL